MFSQYEDLRRDKSPKRLKFGAPSACVEQDFFLCVGLKQILTPCVTFWGVENPQAEKLDSFKRR